MYKNEQIPIHVYKGKHRYLWKAISHGRANVQVDVSISFVLTLVEVTWSFLYNCTCVHTYLYSRCNVINSQLDIIPIPGCIITDCFCSNPDYNVINKANSRLFLIIKLLIRDLLRNAILYIYTGILNRVCIVFLCDIRFWRLCI